MAVISRRHSPNQFNRPPKNYMKSFNSNFSSLQDFENISNNMNEPLVKYDSYIVDHGLNERLKVLTNDLVTKMNNTHTQTPLREPAQTSDNSHLRQRRFSEHYLKDPRLLQVHSDANSAPFDSLDGNRDDSNGNIRKHFDLISNLLIRPQDYVKVIVNLENFQHHRYLVVVVTKVNKDMPKDKEDMSKDKDKASTTPTSSSSSSSSWIEEAAILGIDITASHPATSTIGLMLPIFSDTEISLDGDGGFSVMSNDHIHLFKPVSIQAMWSALQSLMSVAANSRLHKQHSRNPASHQWTLHYAQQMTASGQEYINEWNAMTGIESHREIISDQVDTEKEKIEKEIRNTLRSLMATVDLDEITSKMLRSLLEDKMDMKLRDYSAFIDNEMIKILRQMDTSSMIFDHLFLGSEWNASNLKELQNNGIDHILNVSCEIDNFYPGIINYKNVRVYDNETEQLINYWQDTYKYIEDAKNKGGKVLVHCKMGISRSASTVIAYAMKAFDWTLSHALDHVKNARSCIKPNSGFLHQLQTYQGILDASKQRNNQLWRSFSTGNLTGKFASRRRSTLSNIGRVQERHAQLTSSTITTTTSTIPEPASPTSMILTTSSASSSPVQGRHHHHQDTPICHASIAASGSGSAPASIRSKTPIKRALCCPEANLHFQSNVKLLNSSKTSETTSATSAAAVPLPQYSDLIYQVLPDSSLDSFSNSFNSQSNVRDKLLPPLPGNLVNSNSTGTLCDANAGKEKKVKERAVQLESPQTPGLPNRDNLNLLSKDSCDTLNEITFS